MNSKLFISAIIILGLACIVYFVSKAAIKPRINNIQNTAKMCTLESNMNTPLKIESPIPFGYKSAWLAIKTNDSNAVVKSLGLTRIRDANWSTGLEVANNTNGEVFVTCPLDEWVLVIGLSLPDSGDSERPDKITPILKKLSGEFGEALYFGSHRVVDFYAWAKLIDGKIIREYAYLGEKGETTWNIGEKSKEEIQLGFNFFDENSLEALEDGYWERTDLTYPNEDSVLGISKLWSIDTTFEGKSYPPKNGIIGMLK